MREEYDFNPSRKNPYAMQFEKSVTIRLDHDSIACFKSLSEEMGIPNQSGINLYLRDCTSGRKKLSLAWEPAS